MNIEEENKKILSQILLLLKSEGKDTNTKLIALVNKLSPQEEFEKLKNLNPDTIIEFINEFKLQGLNSSEFFQIWYTKHRDDLLEEFELLLEKVITQSKTNKLNEINDLLEKSFIKTRRFDLKDIWIWQQSQAEIKAKELGEEATSKHLEMYSKIKKKVKKEKKEREKKEGEDKEKIKKGEPTEGKIIAIEEVIDPHSPTAINVIEQKRQAELEAKLEAELVVKAKLEEEEEEEEEEEYYIPIKEGIVIEEYKIKEGTCQYDQKFKPWIGNVKNIYILPLNEEEIVDNKYFDIENPAKIDGTKWYLASDILFFDLCNEDLFQDGDVLTIGDKQFYIGILLNDDEFIIQNEDIFEMEKNYLEKNYSQDYTKIGLNNLQNFENIENLRNLIKMDIVNQLEDVDSEYINQIEEELFNKNKNNTINEYLKDFIKIYSFINDEYFGKYANVFKERLKLKFYKPNKVVDLSTYEKFPQINQPNVEDVVRQHFEKTFKKFEEKIIDDKLKFLHQTSNPMKRYTATSSIFFKQIYISYYCIYDLFREDKYEETKLENPEITEEEKIQQIIRKKFEILPQQEKEIYRQEVEVQNNYIKESLSQ